MFRVLRVSARYGLKRVSNLCREEYHRSGAQGNTINATNERKRMKPTTYVLIITHILEKALN
jgi:hypothetical protein